MELNIISKRYWIYLRKIFAVFAGVYGYSLGYGYGGEIYVHRLGYEPFFENEAIAIWNPEVIVFSACGMPMEQSIDEVNAVLKQPHWKELKAYQNNNIWVVEGSLFTQPGAGLVDGIELLAGIFHSEHFDIPTRLKPEYVHLDLTKG